MKRALLTGFFSTFGDIEVLNVVKNWLDEIEINYDVAAYSQEVNKSISRSVNIRDANPSDYTHLIIICGPFWKNFYLDNRLDFSGFSHCNIIGVNLTLVESKDVFNPFNSIFIRDFNGVSVPDLSLFRETTVKPVIGVCLIAQQPEYGSRQNHEFIQSMISETLKTANYGVVKIDTKWPFERNEVFCTSPDAFDSVCKRVDLLVTNRLHGMVLGLKAGVPVIAIDPVIGGDKVIAQGKALDWPLTFAGEEMNAEILRQKIDLCLSEDYRTLVTDKINLAKKKIDHIKSEFIASVIQDQISTDRDAFPSIKRVPPSESNTTSASSKLFQISTEIAMRLVRLLRSKRN